MDGAEGLDGVYVLAATRSGRLHTFLILAIVHHVVIFQSS